MFNRYVSLLSLNQAISGERLWIELKRIAEGRNAGPVLKRMLRSNIGQYLGITYSRIVFMS